MSRLAVLDDCKETKCHPIFAVGGLVVDLEKLADVEQQWLDGKTSAGLQPDRHLKFANAAPEVCRALFGVIGRMPIQALAVLLEDFRPRRMRLPSSTTRRDIYVYRQAFEYALQRLSRQFTEGSPRPHLVAFDQRDDFAELEEVYSRCYRGDWPVGKEQNWPALKDVGFTAGLIRLAHGPLHEIADFIVGGLTLFAGVRCAKHRGKAVDEGRRAKHDVCRAIVPLFPRRSDNRRRLGWSVVTHTRELTGKELLKNKLEEWLDALERAPAVGRTEGR
ncbi:hypothetical protein [Thermoleophilum album]|uniref:Uncharacterized protein n=1 Tax=Thermoleophilum album TaxID=29539 RepID=A0A1H6G341_THEAL|nr:hypothetical protein [Thermoleophilum album]SEH16315.1 hypothetical protein SAMN02745716_2141 [Thermoleophilum album]